MKKLLKKIRRHPKPEKLKTTVLTVLTMMVILVGVCLLKPELNLSSNQNYQSNDK